MSSGRDGLCAHAEAGRLPNDVCALAIGRSPVIRHSEPIPVYCGTKRLRKLKQAARVTEPGPWATRVLHHSQHGIRYHGAQEKRVQLVGKGFPGVVR